MLYYKIAKISSHIVAWIPLLWLIYGAFTRQLGGDPQEKMLHELGSWGLIFLLLSLSMTPARVFIQKIPFIKFRRMLGLYAAFYLLLHLLVYLTFYLGFSFQELFTEIAKRPYITVGMLAFCGLIPLTFTSTKSAQKRLGKKWKKLHQLVYPVVGLGVVHYIWQSKSDLNEPLLYVVWAFVLLAVRLYKNRRHKVGKKPAPSMDKSAGG